MILNLKKIFWKFKWSERLILTSNLLALISTFFPWFHQVNFNSAWTRVEESFNAFNWLLAIQWYFFLIFVTANLLFIFLKNELKLENKWLSLFLNWQALFIAVSTFLIYNSYWIQMIYYNIWFWLYLAIIAEFIWFFSSHYYFLKTDKSRKIENLSFKKTNY